MTTAVRSLSCPSCGGAVVIRGFAHTRTVVCERCASVLDASDPSLRVLERFDRAMRITPRIPLGARGTWHGDPYQMIGVQQRCIAVDGERYCWEEYLLFNPYAGFRYLTVYEGHWNDVVPLRALPAAGTGARATATLGGETFRHFQRARATTTFAAGEFPWEVRVGDAVTVDDFVAPPRLLSRETTADEITWSLGTYVPGPRVWAAFRLDGPPPPARGVFANQPSPIGTSAREMWRLFRWFALAATAIFGVVSALARHERVLSQRYTFVPAQTPPFVTRPFDLRGHTSNVEITVDADLSNQWLALALTLVNDSTGTAYDVGREVSYYAGVEGGESWSEGSRHDRVRIPAVPSGRYILRVEPDGGGDGAAARPISYALTVRRDVPPVGYYLFALLLLAAPPVWTSLRAGRFEAARWRESDYAPVASGDDDE